MKHTSTSLLAAVILFTSPFAAVADIKIHTAETDYQNGTQEIHVLLPDNYSTGRLYRVLYVLPVEPGFQQRFGYALSVLQEMNAHNRYDIIMVQMGFEKEPWFGDHATDLRTRQASYLKDYVVPFIEERYSTLREPEGRLLFGFSKSGWGAFSLLLTYPDCFGYAASWDAPLLIREFHFGWNRCMAPLSSLLSTVRSPDPQTEGLLSAQNPPRLVRRKSVGTMIPAPGGAAIRWKRICCSRKKESGTFITTAWLHRTAGTGHGWLPPWRRSCG